jgi:dienelactone hydrolase
MKRAILSCVALLATAVTAFSAAAQPAATTAAPAGAREEVIFVKRQLFPFDAELETTIYRPAGTPPWPMVVINHGQTDFGDHRLQQRNRPVVTAGFFLERGYLVVVPMRQGFSRSSGVYAFNCDHERYALRYAGDIAAVVDHFIASGEARPDQVLATGQSNGGMVLLGYAAKTAEHVPKARAVINFAGGFNSPRPECHWREGMVNAARSLGAKTQIPALWLYARDDHIFPPELSTAFFEAYHQGNAASAFKLYPRGGHGMSNTRSGRQIWGADVERFLREVGLPWEVTQTSAAQGATQPDGK